ncbi:MAG: prolyl oligopeptidase family serine peptidase [Kofleriaceae bacterium]
MRVLVIAGLIGCAASKPDVTVPAPPPAPPVVVEKTVTEPVHPWPATKANPLVEDLNGKKVSDPYRWLEDEKADDVQKWMAAQDAYTRAELAKLPLRSELEARIKQLFYFDAISAPAHRKGRYFYSRKLATKEKSIIYWKQGETGDEKVLFDPNTWSEDGSKGLHGWWPDYDGKHVAYTVSEHNSDETTMHVIDVTTGKDTGDVIEGTKYAAASWTPDGKGFYYTWLPPVGGNVTVAQRPGFAELRYHTLGTPADKDPVIHEATHDAESFIGGGVSHDGKWLIAQIQHGWNSTDIYIRDAHDAKAKWTTLVAGVAANYGVDIWKDKLYIKTDEGASRSKIMIADAHAPAKDKWKELVPEAQGTLESSAIVGGMLVLTYLENATSRISIHSLDGKHVRDVQLPGIGTSGGISGEPDEDAGYYSFTSFTEPQIIYKTSIKSGKSDEWARVKLPIDTSNMTTEQVWYPSKDGTKISMFLIHRKDAKKDGSNPTILYGYGGFSISLTPAFAGSRVVWLENGGVYAIPNLRGGGEYGEEWHKAGMLANKQNVFDDFIAAAEYLEHEGWTSKEHLAINGGSNGGLLTGAVVTQRPDLMKAVVCAVPLLDMLRYHLSGSGMTWVPEYGSAADKDQFAALYAYSPYRIAVDAGKREYPAIMFDSADHDDRVDPLHARKLAAVIQANQTGSAPIYLRIERNSGHGGADMVKSQVERSVDTLSFLLHELK